MIHLHVVWVTKYRKPILRGDLAHRARDLVREICRAEDVEILKGHIAKDHLHASPPTPPPSTRRLPVVPLPVAGVPGPEPGASVCCATLPGPLA